MRERRWESRTVLSPEQFLRLSQSIKNLGLHFREPHQEAACYIEDFRIGKLDEIERLEQWPIDEITLVQTRPHWEGDFFLLAGRHHHLYLRHPAMEAYLSLSHPWRLPAALQIKLHQEEAMFWIGFRDTHAFIRVRVVSNEIITPGERRGESRRIAWMTERASAFSAAIEALDLPLFVEWEKGVLSVSAPDSATAVSYSWPDAFGPCQFEYVVSNRYELLTPAARLVSQLGVRPATVRTFLSGFSQEALQEFHQLQPDAEMLYRGFVHATLNDLPKISEAIAPNGRALITLTEFQTSKVFPEGEESYAVIGAIGSGDGIKIEARFNRAPFPEENMEEWLTQLIGAPMGYAPLPLY